MKEIYWISKLDTIYGSFALMLAIGLVVMLVTLTFYLLEVNENKLDFQEKLIKYSLISATIGILGISFIPSTEQALITYGIGGTRDYLKQNKKIPEKYEKALDIWTTNLNEKSFKRTNGKEN